MVSVWETSRESLLHFLNDFGPDLVFIEAMETSPEQIRDPLFIERRPGPFIERQKASIEKIKENTIQNKEKK